MTPANSRPGSEVHCVLALIFVVGYVGVWKWTICRVEVPPGSSLLLRYKRPPADRPYGAGARGGRWCKPDARGRPLKVSVFSSRCPVRAGTSTRPWSTSRSWFPT